MIGPSLAKHCQGHAYGDGVRRRPRTELAPREHLKGFSGFLQADGYAGFDGLYESGRVVEVACWAHVRRKFFDVHQANGSAIAREALDRIGTLYAIEAEIRGRLPNDRHRTRQARAGPLLAELKTWLEATRPKLSGKSDLAAAMRQFR